MKIQITRLFILPFFLILSLVVKAQTSDWTPVFLTPSGNHVVKGVEAYFQQATCESNGVVFIKFVNTNDYAVNLEWYNAIFTQELQWIHREDDKKSILIPAATTLNGSCNGELILSVDLSLFVQDPAQFKRLSTVGLIINAAN